MSARPALGAAQWVWIWFGAASGVFGSIEPAHAQASAEPRPNVPRPAVSELPSEEEAADLALSVVDGAQLQEILVTAQKRWESLQEIPVSVRTLTGEEVSRPRASGADVRFLAARIPSLMIESSFGRTFPRFYMRGLGNTDFDLNASQPVSMMLDEVVLENPILKGFPLFDVERVEVLRGPQGTLFGRNTPAGIVKFESVRPSFDFEAQARATYGTFDFVGLEAAAGGPLIPRLLAARVSVLYERRDDWVDNTFTEQGNQYEGFEDVAGRVQLLFTPGRLRALLNLHAHSYHGTARLFRANIIEPGTDEFVDDFRRDEVAIDGRNEQEIEQLGLVANLEYDAGPLTITSISGYESLQTFARGDIDGGFGAAFAPPSGPGNIPFSSKPPTEFSGYGSSRRNFGSPRTTGGSSTFRQVASTFTRISKSTASASTLSRTAPSTAGPSRVRPPTPSPDLRQ